LIFIKLSNKPWPVLEIELVERSPSAVDLARVHFPEIEHAGRFAHFPEIEHAGRFAHFPEIEHAGSFAHFPEIEHAGSFAHFPEIEHAPRAFAIKATGLSQFSRKRRGGTHAVALKLTNAHVLDDI